MFLKKTFIKFSDIHGIGCFAQEDIQKGEKVWELFPDLDIAIPVEKIHSYPEPVINFLKMYTYGQQARSKVLEIYTPEQQGGSKQVFILCGDNARHMNHSDDPNLIESEENPVINIAAKDIKAGEEITCNYYDFDTVALFKLNGFENK